MRRPKMTRSMGTDGAKSVLISGRDTARLLDLCTALQGKLEAHYARPSEIREFISRTHYAVVVLEAAEAGVIDAIHESAGHEGTVVLVMVPARDEPPALDPRRVHGLLQQPVDSGGTARLIQACIAVQERRSLGAMCAGAMASLPLILMLTS